MNPVSIMIIASISFCAGKIQYYDGKCPEDMPGINCKCYDSLRVYCTQITSMNDVKKYLNRPLKLNWLTVEISMETLPPQAFGCLDVIHLVIEGCNLKYIDDNAFEGIASTLVRIFITDTSITEVPKAAFHHIPQLRQLHLENNKITHIRNLDFIKITKLRSLKLFSNKISIVEDKAFQEIEILDFLDIHDNPFKCDMTLFSFLVYLKSSTSSKRISLIDSNNTTCKVPPQLSGISLTNLITDQLSTEHQE